VGNWVRKARAERAAAVPADAPLDEGDRFRLMRVEAELKDANATISELRMQVEFAKKVASWFAKTQQ
jgi:transposase